jgi:hypothetical protein
MVSPGGELAELADMASVWMAEEKQIKVGEGMERLLRGEEPDRS